MYVRLWHIFHWTWSSTCSDCINIWKWWSTRKWRGNKYPHPLCVFFYSSLFSFINNPYNLIRINIFYYLFIYFFIIVMSKWRGKTLRLYLPRYFTLSFIQKHHCRNIINARVFSSFMAIRVSGLSKRKKIGLLLCYQYEFYINLLLYLTAANILIFNNHHLILIIYFQHARSQCFS